MAQQRLPAVRRLSAELHALPIDESRTVKDAADFLVNRRTQVAAFGSATDLGLAAAGDPEGGVAPDPVARGLEHHMIEVRAALARALWQRQIFIDVEVLDDLIFGALADPGSGDPVVAVLEYLRDRRANRPGLVLFPLHSFAILWAGLHRRAGLRYINPDWGIALTPQTRSFAATYRFIEEARTAFGVGKPVDEDDLAHWRRSRPTKWLEENPLIAVRVTGQTGSYYGIEPLLLSRVQAAATLIAMVSTFQPPVDERAAYFFSSRRVNNWETRDIHHYLYFQDNPAQTKKLDGMCTPIQERTYDVVGLSELRVELDPAYRSRRRQLFEEIEQAMTQVYGGWVVKRYGRGGNAREGFQQRMFESAGYFRRSFEDRAGSWSATLSLATAFEMLLTDSFGRNTDERLRRRTGLVLRGVRGVRSFQNAVYEAYRARNRAIHTGEPEHMNLTTARRAYVYLFTRLAQRVPSLSPTSTTPARDLTGDTA